MKFISSLSDNDISALQDICKKSASHRMRQRAHSILLSYKKFKINELAAIFDVDRDTISLWLKNWEIDGLTGLSDKARTGRPCILTVEDRKKLEELIEKKPHQTKEVHAELVEETKKSFSRSTMIRSLKKNRYEI